MPYVSVVLPTFNRAATLPRAIESVLKQEYQDIELIIVDDGSTDNTKEVISQYLSNPKVKYIFQENSGASSARNLGIKVSSGELIAFQDSDDEWLEGKLTKQVEVFNNNDESLSMVYSDVIRIETDGTSTYNQVPDIQNKNLFNEETLEFNVFSIGLQTCLIRKKYLLDIGGFDTKLPRFIDLDLFIVLSKVSRLHRIKEPLVKYYATEGISTNSINAAKAREIIVEKYQAEAEQYPACLANQYLQIAGCYWKTQEKQQLKKYTYKVLKIKKAKFMTKFQALLLLITPRWIGKIILGR